ncbi:chromosome segregation protein SMC [Spirochaetia bacterium]|nr:chromosome segregation protein SMC [Spirochaetia bacterium]GHU33639.1 chromosome segregation protein SMC [Spirochaetia bacterium]
MLINSIKLNNFLSFGETAEPVSLRPLNVVIGPNGSGKSNLLEAIDLLRNAPHKLTKPVREGGGVSEWLWKGARDTPIARIDTMIKYSIGSPWLHYVLSFTSVNRRFEITDEHIEYEKTDNPISNFYYHYDDGTSILNTDRENEEAFKPTNLKYDESILSQLRDPERYKEITYLAEELNKIKLYREWSFGRRSNVRVPEKADLPNDMLETDTSNLGLVLHRLSMEPKTKQRILDALQLLICGIDDFGVSIESATVQVFLREGNYTIPATRLSDGTLRYLCLLAILCNPNPPPLVCIEEPELGLHPDILPTLAELMKEASTRCQLIVTTHSDILVDTMTEQPESVLICEKGETGTELRRLSAEELKPWLEKYRLGELWISGQLGGTRW